MWKEDRNIWLFEYIILIFSVLYLKINYRNDKYSKINFEIFLILFKLPFFSLFKRFIPYIFGINIRFEASPLSKSIRIIQLPDYCHQSMNSLCKSIRNHGWINVWTHLVNYREREGEWFMRENFNRAKICWFRFCKTAAIHHDDYLAQVFQYRLTFVQFYCERFIT